MDKTLPRARVISAAVLLTFGLASVTPAFAQTSGTTSGPAAGSTAKPSAGMHKSKKKKMQAPSAGAASVGAPGTAGKAGAESDPGTVPPPGQK